MAYQVQGSKSTQFGVLLLTECRRNLDAIPLCLNKLWNRRLGIVVLRWSSRMIKLEEAIRDWLRSRDRWLRQIRDTNAPPCNPNAPSCRHDRAAQPLPKTTHHPAARVFVLTQFSVTPTIQQRVASGQEGRLTGSNQPPEARRGWQCSSARNRSSP